MVGRWWGGRRCEWCLWFGFAGQDPAKIVAIPPVGVPRRKPPRGRLRTTPVYKTPWQRSPLHTTHHLTLTGPCRLPLFLLYNIITVHTNTNRLVLRVRPRATTCENMIHLASWGAERSDMIRGAFTATSDDTSAELWDCGATKI